MIIEKGSDLILELDLKDDKGALIDIATKPSFYVKVFTTSKQNFLKFDRGLITDNNSLHIEASLLALLESGVIAYVYGWGVTDSNFSDKEYNRTQTKYTDYYLKNDAVVITNPVTPIIPVGDNNTLPVYCGGLPTKDLDNILNIDTTYINNLMDRGRATTGKVKEDYVQYNANLEPVVDDEGVEHFYLFVLVPSNYPSLSYMTTTVLQFTKGAFEVYNNIPIQIGETTVGYTLYRYVQEIFRCGLQIKFIFEEDIEEYVKQNPTLFIGSDIANELLKINQRIDNIITVEGNTLYINTSKSNG